MSEELVPLLQSSQKVLEQVKVIETPRMGSGTAFPTGITAGYRFFRTDLGFDCYYDGTQWLSLNIYSASLPQYTFTATGSYISKVLRQDFAPYIIRLSAEFLVLTTNNATNFWTVTVRGASSSYAATTTIHTFNTSGLAANTWANVDTSFPSGTATPTNRALFDVSAVPTLAPGTLVISVNIDYRLIIT